MADTKSIAMADLKGADAGGGGGGGASAVATFRVVHAQDGLKNRALGYPNNAISNTKYNALTFLPKNLFEQFSLNINRYFLIIAILQLFNVLTPVNPLSTWGPLIVIFAISAAKEATDDWGRRNEDRAANERLVTVYRNTTTGYTKMEVQSQFVEVGDVLYLREDEQVPCDILLLKSSGADGSCFITTTNLDGETNLKQRQAPPASRDKPEEEIWAFRGVVKCPTPNRQLYAFDAQLYLDPSPNLEAPRAQEPIPISSPQLIQQTTSIRNTEWIYGLVVYTGNETKFGNNKGIPPLKLTKVDLFINLMSIYVFIFQLGLVVIFGAIGENLRREHIPGRATNGKEGLWYLYPPESAGYSSDASYEVVVIPLRFLLLNSTMIPISLKITLDLCKLAYANFIGWDLNMYDAQARGGAVANNTGISEDLGQIEYVLTDKTGTLTQNSMVFRQLSINGVLYEQRDAGANGALHQAIKEGRQWEVDLMRNLVLNNSVVPQQKNPDKPKASSPDEAALVEAARYLGCKLLVRENENVEISICDQKERYRVRQELEFTSERKRMSVIVEDLKTHKLLMFTKGADEALLDRLRADQNAKPTLTHLDAFADQGLRTLMYCYRELSEEEFAKWQEEFKEANAALQDRQRKREAAYDNLEKDLVIQGGSAIEDKLQDDVAHTIDVLRAARVKFWMLTGDKYSTALQIATACNLKSPEDRSILCSIEGSTKDAVGECIRVYLKELKSHGTAKFGSVSGADSARNSQDRRSNSSASQTQREMEAAQAADFKEYGPYYDVISEEDDHFKTDVTVIIRGSTLQLALEHHKRDFTKLCLMANTVICCRVAPSQKAELVKLVREHGKMTLAIGDGGNDVAMIQAANIGVGIRGREGMQAARASDYQVANFRSLKYLLLVHGRYSYMRTALVAQYSFYKSLCFCGIQIAYCFFSLFSGVSLFNSLSITGYNAILFFPIVTFILDKDVPTEVALNHPILYRHAAKSHAFNVWTFLRWMFRAVVHATLLFAFTVQTRSDSYHQAHHGYGSDYETLGVVTFCGYLWVQSTTMAMSLHNLALFNIIFIWAFHWLCFLILWGTNNSFTFQSLNPYYATTQTFADLQFWFVNLLMLVACIVPVLFVDTWAFNYRPSRADNLRYDNIVLGKTHTKFGQSTPNPNIGSGKSASAGSAGVNGAANAPLLANADVQTPRNDEKSAVPAVVLPESENKSDAPASGATDGPSSAVVTAAVVQADAAADVQIQMPSTTGDTAAAMPAAAEPAPVQADGGQSSAAPVEVVSVEPVAAVLLPVPDAAPVSADAGAEAQAPAAAPADN